MQIIRVPTSTRLVQNCCKPTQFTIIRSLSIVNNVLTLLVSRYIQIKFFTNQNCVILQLYFEIIEEIKGYKRLHRFLVY